jgi:tetratricopeptide (TPR) repeat protein
MTLTSKILLGTGFLCVLATSPTFAAKHEVWVEARSPHFIVVCDAGEKQARKTAIQFEQIRAVFRKYIAIASGYPSPTITILAVKNEDSLRQLLPEYWATKGHAHPAGIFFYNMGQFEAAIQLDAQGANPYEAIYHEYYHSLTLPYLPGLPLWVAEGFADFFGNSEVTEKEAHLGEPDPNLIEELRQNRLIPLDVLFKVDHASPYYNEQNKTSIFYAESWALTHFLMLGDNGSHKPLLAAYLEALQKGATPEAASKGFGDLNNLQKALERYINGNSFLEVRGPTPPLGDVDLRTRDLSDAEADAYLGGFAAIRGRVQDAQGLLTQAVQLDPKLALGYRNLGLAQLFAGKRDEALASFSQAVTLDPKDAMTHYFRAYLVLAGQVESARDPEVENDLRQAIALDADFARPYSLLAVYLAGSDETVSEAFSIANKGVALEPGDVTCMLALAQVLARMRRFDEAQLEAERARADAIRPGEHAEAEQVLEYIQRARGAFAERRLYESAPAAPATEPQPPTANTSTRALEKVFDSGVSTWLRTSGMITRSACAGGTQEIELKTSTATLILRAPQQGGLDINVSPDITAKFGRCQLQGLRASVLYRSEPNSPQSGIMSVIQILGRTENGQDSSEASVGDGVQSVSSAEGQIRDVTCAGSEMILKVSFAAGQLAVHSRDFTRLAYYDDRPGPKSDDFDPCKQLTGHMARIIFVVYDHKRYDGDIQSIEITK